MLHCRCAMPNARWLKRACCWHSQHSPVGGGGSSISKVEAATVTLMQVWHQRPRCGGCCAWLWHRGCWRAQPVPAMLCGSATPRSQRRYVQITPAQSGGTATAEAAIAKTLTCITLNDAASLHLALEPTQLVSHSVALKNWRSCLEALCQHDGDTTLPASSCS